MGDNRSKSEYRGILVPDPRIKYSSINATDSTITEGEPKPGVPEDQNTPKSAMVLQTSGQQAADTTMEVMTQRGGFPGSSKRSGGFIHRLSTANWLGWDAPHRITGMQFLNHTTSSTYGLKQAHIIRLQNGSALACFWARNVAPSLTGISIRAFDPDAGTWSTTETVQSDDLTISSTPNVYPTLCQLPSGRILLYYWVKDTVTDTAQIQMQYSDDNGNNWTLGSRWVLPTAIDTSVYNLRRIRAAYSGGQILMIAQVNDPSKTAASEDPEALVQWASDDEGVSFTQIAFFDLSTVPTNNGAFPEILPTSSGGFYVLYLDFNSGGNPWNTARIANAYQSIVGEDTDEFTGNDSDAGEDSAMWSGEDGTWYILYNDTTPNNDNVLYRSIDEGYTWERMGGQSSNTFFNSGETSQYFTEYTATEVRGRTIVLARPETNAGSLDALSMMAIYGGGYSNLTMPSISKFSTDLTQMGNQRTWLSFWEPDDVGNVWDKTTTGTPTTTLTSSGLQITTSTEQCYYSLDSAGAPFPPSAVDEELIVHIQAQVISGGGAGFPIIGARVRQADGTDDYDVVITMVSSGYRVYDANGSPTLIQQVALDLTTEFELLIAMLNGQVRVWHRSVGAAGEISRGDWTQGATSASLISDTSTPETYSDVQFGGITSGTGDSYWKMVNYMTQDVGAPSLADGVSNPADLFPRPYSSKPLSLYQGTKIAAVDGPSVRGEEWAITTRSPYGVELIDPAISPSPRQQWRTSAISQQTIVWDIAPDSAEDSSFFGPDQPIAIGVFGCNWRQAILYGVPAAGGGDTAIMTLAMHAGMNSLQFTRKGNIVVPNGTTGNAGFWIEENELAGYTIDLDGDYRRISRNTAGYWTDDTSLTQKPSLYIEDMTGSEATSGDCEIWASDAVFFLYTPPSPAEWNQLKLVIAPNNNADGYLATGNVVIGNVKLFGRQYSRGRVSTISPNVDMTTRRGGTRYTRKLGPERRSVEFAWKEGIDTQPIHDLDPDYSRIGPFISAVVAATPADTPNLMEGILRWVDGPHTPLVYLPRVDGVGSAGTTESLNRRKDFLYGRLMSDVRTESIIGNEQDDEVQRINTIEISEEI